MTFGQMAWRPRLRQIGFAPKGEEWRCWIPGLNSHAGERWVTEEVRSLRERLQMLINARDERDLKRFMRDTDVYSIMHVEDLFKAVLHLPKPLAEMLDDERVPRTKYVEHFRPLFGPMPQFHGPLELSGLRSLEAGYVDSPVGFKNRETVVQPMMRHIPNLPLFASPSDWVATLKDLVKLHPID